MHIPIAGIVLAGGLSARFGADKAQAQYAGRTFLQIAIDLLRQVCITVVISGCPRRTISHPIKCIPDEIPAGGPMSGIATVVRKLKSEWLLIIPCDMPLIATETLQQMIDKIPEGKTIVWKVTGERVQPFPMLLNRQAASQALKQLGQSAGLSIKAMLRMLPHQEIEIPANQLYQFSNINTQSEFNKICHNQQ